MFDDLEIMEVDPPSASMSAANSAGDLHAGDLHASEMHSSSGCGSTLKRSNSAPMINVLVSTAHSQPQISPPSFRPADVTRIRRFSSSSMCLHSPTTPIKIPDRVNRLKQEESHIVEKEKEHEREMTSTLQMSSSWGEKFTLEDHTDHEPMISDHFTRRPRSFSETLHIYTSPSSHYGGAPSPTRVGKQCFSPSMQMPVKNHTFTPSPSPSPTRKSFFNRSLSPIAIRPSPLGKRKLETDTDSYLSPSKKFHSGPITPDRNIPHPLAHNVSSSSLDEGSPDQTVPRDSGILQEIRTRARPQPHMYGFMPLRDTQDMQTTDSETSDITESTDMSDNSLSLSSSPGTSIFQPIRQTHL